MFVLFFASQTEDDPCAIKKSTNPFDSNDSPLDSDASDLGMDIDRTQLPQPSRPSIVCLKKLLFVCFF